MLHKQRNSPIAPAIGRVSRTVTGDVSVLRERYNALQRLSESANRVLACFKSSPERRLTPAELIEDTGLVRRTVQNALRSLVDAGIIQRLGAGRGTRYQLNF